MIICGKYTRYAPIKQRSVQPYFMNCLDATSVASAFILPYLLNNRKQHFHILV